MRDFTEHGLGIRVGDDYCVVIEKKAGVMGWVEDGERHPLPLPTEFASVQTIPPSRLAVVFNAYALVHPDDGLRELLTSQTLGESHVARTQS